MKNKRDGNIFLIFCSGGGDLSEVMSYNLKTMYHLCKREDILEKLKEINIFVAAVLNESHRNSRFGIDLSNGSDLNWVDNIKDVRDLSKKFMNEIFVLTVQGNNVMEDNDRYYIKNGDVKHTHGCFLSTDPDVDDYTDEVIDYPDSFYGIMTISWKNYMSTKKIPVKEVFKSIKGIDPYAISTVFSTAYDYELHQEENYDGDYEEELWECDWNGYYDLFKELSKQYIELRFMVHIQDEETLNNYSIYFFKGKTYVDTSVLYFEPYSKL